MTTKRKELSDLQRDLLQLALQGPKAKIWLPKTSQQSFPTTYAAIVSLQRRGLLDAEQTKDPEVLSWKVTKEGREALKVAKAEPSPRAQSVPVPAASSGSTAKVSVAPAAAPKRSSPPAPPPAEPHSRGAKDREPVAPAKPNRSARAMPVAPAERSREKGSRGKEAAAPAKPSRSPAAATDSPRERGAKGKAAPTAASRSASKKALAAPKKSGGRGRT
jgi:hypothetical protein